MNLACYVFVHSRIANVDKLVQCTHAVATMVDNYQASPMLKHWAANDRTLLAFEGGSSCDLKHKIEKVREAAAHYDLPYSVFAEDVATLDGITTATCFVAERDNLPKNLAKIVQQSKLLTL